MCSFFQASVSKCTVVLCLILLSNRSCRPKDGNVDEAENKAAMCNERLSATLVNREGEMMEDK